MSIQKSRKITPVFPQSAFAKLVAIVIGVAGCCLSRLLADDQNVPSWAEFLVHRYL